MDNLSSEEIELLKILYTAENMGIFLSEDELSNVYLQKYE